MAHVWIEQCKPDCLQWRWRGGGLACSTGIGCTAAFVTGTAIADNLIAGSKKLTTGASVVTYGETVLQSLGWSAQAAAATYAIVGIAPTAVERYFASRVAAPASRVSVAANNTGKGDGANSEVPHGFASAEEFIQFGKNVRTGLGSAGYSDVEPILQGSAVTGKSFRTGNPFVIGRVSDFDVGLASRAMLNRAEELGIGLRSIGTRTGPLTTRDLRLLGLRDLSNSLSQQTGRDVNFMIYDNSTTAIQRAPGITLPNLGK